MTKEELVDLVNGFTSKLEEYKKAVDELKTSIYDDFINPAAEEYKRFDHDTRLGEFKEKYKDLLEPLVGPCKAAEQNPDFDVYDQIFKDYNENTDENKMEEGEYVAQAVAAITEQIEALKASLGAEKVEVKNEEGETVVKADGEKVAEAETEEEKKVEEPTEASNDDKSNDEEDPFEKEMEEALKNSSRFSLK